MASSQVIRGMGNATSRPMASRHTSATMRSVASITSSTSTKDISRSTWVNSGCLSARRSSSLKHLAIWKYLSYPEHISSCLKIWGDWGSA